MMHIFEKLPTLILRQPINHFSSWLYKVVVNECLQSIRKTKRINETQHLDHLIAEDTDEDHTADMAINQLLQCVDAHSECHGGVIMLSFGNFAHTRLDGHIVMFIIN